MSAPPELPPVIETARLHLRRPAFSDASMLLERWAGDPDTTRYLLFPTYARGDFAAAERFLGTCVQNWDEGRAHRPWVIHERGEPLPIGMIGVSPGSGPHALEIGYVLGRHWWGRGYATELVRAITDRLFEDGRLWRVFATTHIANAASQRVLAKAGYAREATLKRYHLFPNFAPEPQDCSLWARSRDDLAPMTKA